MITTCCVLSAGAAVREPIRWTSERTALAPSETAKTAMISQISSLRARPGSGCGDAEAHETTP